MRSSPSLTRVDRERRDGEELLDVDPQLAEALQLSIESKMEEDSQAALEAQLSGMNATSAHSHPGAAALARLVQDAAREGSSWAQAALEAQLSGMNATSAHSHPGACSYSFPWSMAEFERRWDDAVREDDRVQHTPAGEIDYGISDAVVSPLRVNPAVPLLAAEAVDEESISVGEESISGDDDTELAQLRRAVTNLQRQFEQPARATVVRVENEKDSSWTLPVTQALCVAAGLGLGLWLRTSGPSK